jgi:hypothetical protein
MKHTKAFEEFEFRDEEGGKTYTEVDVVHLIMELAMDHLGEEWVAEEDEGFKSWLDKQGLLDTWEKIYGEE